MFRWDGKHFVYNALCAITVAKELGIDVEKVKEGLQSFELTGKRMEFSTLENGAKIINDSYNASYESMQASLKYLSTFSELRRVAVLGDMLELGEFSKELHLKTGREVLNCNIDVLICIGNEAKYIAEGAKDAGMREVKYFENQDEALIFLKKEITQNDIVLFKASNGMKFYNLVEKL